MSTLGTNVMTMMDHAKRLDPNGKIDKIAEMLNKVNEVMTDMVVVEGNLATGHKTTMRTGLPTAAWRQINKGVQPSKSSTKQIEFTAGMLEQHGQIDEELLAIAIDPQAFRFSENAPQIESIGQTLATTIFYGDTTINPERFTGLSPYYASGSSTYDSSANVINGGGSDAAVNTSLWLVCWSENTIHGFFPRGSKAGIYHEDLGLQLVEDGITTGAKYRAWIDQYKAKMGLAVRDWRYAVRICNLNTTSLGTAGDTSDSSANLLKLMVRAVNKLPSQKMGKIAWYCNKDVKTALDVKALGKSNMLLTYQQLQSGVPLTSFMGIPIRQCDAIVNTEAVVTGF